jgi:hypothetical protein
MRNVSDILVLGLLLVLIGDILILWVELNRRREENERISKQS